MLLLQEGSYPIMKRLIALVLLVALIFGCEEKVPIDTEYSAGDEVRTVSGGVTPEYGEEILTIVEFNAGKNKYKCTYIDESGEEKVEYLRTLEIIRVEEIEE